MDFLLTGQENCSISKIRGLGKGKKAEK